MSDIISHVNVCITEDELFDKFYKLWEEAYCELEDNYEKCASNTRNASFRLKINAIILIFQVIRTVLDFSVGNIACTIIWVFCVSITFCSWHVSKCPPIPSILKPNRERLKEFSIEEILKSSINFKEDTVLACMKALYQRPVKTLYLTDDNRVCAVDAAGNCIYFKPLCIRGGDINSITINNSGAFFGKQENVVKSSVIESFDVNISFERS